MEMKRYAITHKLEKDGYIYAQIVDGNRLAKLYGFSDCTGFDLIQVMEVMPDGTFEKVNVCGSMKAPYNRLFIVNPRTGHEDIFWWDEH